MISMKNKVGMGKVSFQIMVLIHVLTIGGGISCWWPADPNSTPIDKPVFDPTIRLTGPTLFKASNGPYQVTAADLDKDGALDLIVSSPDDANGDTIVNILKGSGHGTFELIRQILTPAPIQTVASDFDHDGEVDIVEISADGQGPLPNVFLRGTGALNYTKQTWNYPLIDWNGQLSTGDFDEDGTLELVAPYLSKNFPADKIGGFAILSVPSFAIKQQVDCPSLHYPAVGDAVSGDFDGDGHQDVLVGFAAENQVSLYRGDGSGKVTKAFDQALPGEGVMRLFAYDLNGDGFDDFVSTNEDGYVTIAYGNRSGSFSALQHIDAWDYSPPGLYNIAAGDWNQDGRVDLAIGTYGERIVLLLQTDSGFIAGGYLELARDGRHEVASGDFNGDGRSDLAVTDGLESIAIFLGN